MIEVFKCMLKRTMKRRAKLFLGGGKFFLGDVALFFPHACARTPPLLDPHSAPTHVANLVVFFCAARSTSGSKSWCKWV